MQQMLRLLYELHTKDNGFSYRVATDNNSQPCGFVWHTSTMRWKFENNGDVIFLDLLGTKKNSVDWPYIALVIIDGNVRYELL